MFPILSVSIKFHIIFQQIFGEVTTPNYYPFEYNISNIFCIEIDVTKSDNKLEILKNSLLNRTGYTNRPSLSIINTLPLAPFYISDMILPSLCHNILLESWKHIKKMCIINDIKIVLHTKTWMNKAAIALQCQSNVKLIAALLFFT